MKIDILCVQETKIEDWSVNLSRQIWGNRWVDWAEPKSCGTRGGIIILWDRRRWNCLEVHKGTFSISSILESTQEEFRWCFTRIYGPHTNQEREDMWNWLQLGVCGVRIR